MSESITPKQEKFAQRLVETDKPSESYLRSIQVAETLAFIKLTALRKLTRMLPVSSHPRYEAHVAAFESILANESISLIQRLAATDALAWLSRSTSRKRKVLAGVRRGSLPVRKWRAAVLARDGNRCRVCLRTAGLHAHHVQSWADHPELRVTVSNGVTLCPGCHRKAHRAHTCMAVL